MRWLTWHPLSRFSDLSLLVLRAGLGLMMMSHGWPKVAGGERLWTRLGHATEAIGIDVAPTLFGAAASFSELIGGAMLVIGLGTRPASLFLAITMAVASANHLAKGDGINGAAHAIELGVVFIGLLGIGGGRYALDRALSP